MVSRILSGRPKALLGRTKAGQCQRYKGYEIAPNHCIGRLLLISLKKRGQIGIVAISIAVASTGNNALIPGKAVLSLKLKVAIASPIAPIHGKNRLRKYLSGIKRSRAPTPSSQARVGSE